MKRYCGTRSGSDVVRTNSRKSVLPRRYRSVFCIVFLYLVSAKTNAQGFPFDDFLPRTLREIVNENNAAAKDSSLKKDVKSKENFIIDGDPLPSVVRVIYSGK